VTEGLRCASDFIFPKSGKICYPQACHALKNLSTISTLVGHAEKFSCCPGKEAGAEVKKGREKPSKFSPLRFRKETRWPWDRRAETAEARIGKRGTSAFFGEANAFLPGHGIIKDREAT